MSGLNKIACCSCSMLNTKNALKGINLTFVRFRKESWLPRAPSKIYKVRQPTPIDPVEAEKMKEWTKIYNTERKSIHKYIVKHHKHLEELNRQEKKRQIIPFETIFETIERKNDEWNKMVGESRRKAMEDMDDYNKLREDMVAERDVRERDEIRTEARKRVLEAQETMDSFVSPENIDDVIEEVLNSRTDYDFAINLDGNKIEANNHSYHGDNDTSEPKS